MTPRKNSGLTLLEVMVAVLISTMVMFAVGSVVSSTVEGVKLLDSITRAQEIEDGIARVLADDFEFPDPGAKIEFNVRNRPPDDKGEIVCVVHPCPKFITEWDMIKVCYLLDPSPEFEGEFRLLRREISHPLGEKKYTVVLYDRIRSASVQCLHEGEWVDSWNGRARNAIPAAVKWNLEIVIPSERHKGGTYMKKCEMIIIPET